MRKLVGLIAVGVLVVGSAASAAAEDCAGCGGLDWTFGASTSFIYDFNSPDGGSLNEATYANLEQDESFNIDLVQLGVTGSRGSFGFGAKLDYGDLAAVAGDDADGDIALQEAYVTYSGEGIGTMAGRFATPIGYEVLEPWGNAHASRSWAWISQPINHDGLTLNGSADIVDVMIGVVNNFTVGDPAGNDIDDEKGVIGSIGAGISDEVNLYLAGLYTEEGDSNEISVLNGIISGRINAGDRDIRYAVEGYWRHDDVDGSGDDDLWSVVGFVGFNVVGPFDFDLRVEYADDDGIVLPDTEVVSVTPTISVALVDGVVFRVENRVDIADDDVFLDDSSADDLLYTIAAQLVWNPNL